MTKFCRFSAAALLAAAFWAHASASTDDVIAMARAYLGTEAALESVNSIHYTGTLTGEETIKDNTGKEVRRPFNGDIDIIFQKPYYQRVKLVSYKGTEITALDDYEAWRRLEDPADSTRWSLTLLSKDQIKRLRASTWENLAFFRGIEGLGGHVEDHGSTTIDGRSCEKLVFVHEPGIEFSRYFDAATGRLVLTLLESGDRIQEEGEIMVNGVRFPKILIHITKDSTTWKEYATVLTLDKITLNEIFPDSLFAVPMYTGQ
jgi:hypothetical protein